MGVTVRRAPSGVVSLLLLALAGCGGGSSVPVADAPTSDVGESRAEIRIANSLSTDALVLNALSTNALANRMLATQKLQDLFSASGGDAYIRKQLHDPDAQTFMSYLVSCALGPNQVLWYYNPRGPTPGANLWQGKAGLCTSWLTSAPTPDCLNRVSACLLARNNAFGRRVELSIRGEVSGNPSIFYLEPVSRPAEYDPTTATKLPSFEGCHEGETGAQRDCGWTPDGIGSCLPGSQVWVGAGGAVSCPGPTLGASTGGRMALRVCSGVVGCGSASDTALGESESSCSGTGPVVGFTCPAEGYFSVMTAPYDSNDSGVASVAADSSELAAYPLAEAEVFGVREGAFYGNIFDSKALATQVYVEEVRQGDITRYRVVGDDAVVDGAIYKRMYSCYDPQWSNGAAYSSYRVCALPGTGANCASTVAGPCWGSATKGEGRCEIDDGPEVPGDGDYERCRDPFGGLWREPVTTFLHDACGPVKGERALKLCSRTIRTSKER
ncbi:hypothetical protein OWM54_02170 [Myxococcus sp. MISCRS1]|uniref:hypothetical protein n=1 Tax=Myxococcus TaxID=32 RepID=UPI001CBFE0DB|nr:MULTISPECIES: hypothetical protein [unclassified Myxococcus]MBZ4414016.1 hypothetical protein [Myxococcus sp. XM-1-1-1]MCY0995939.1 hypothetical protein [Myxococcus sp. MISCRS1]BDT34080.1 hypothetical protein MFMH1_37490 [Myxococcus sp. MH1]